MALNGVLCGGFVLPLRIWVACTVHDLMCQMRRGGRPLRKDELDTQFSSRIVLLKYVEPWKCVLITGVRLDLSPQSKFLNKKTGKQITY